MLFAEKIIKESMSNENVKLTSKEIGKRWSELNED